MRPTVASLIVQHMDTTTATTDHTFRLHMQTADVLAGARQLLARMRANGAVNGVGYYPREVIAQERRVAMLEATLDSMEAPE